MPKWYNNDLQHVNLSDLNSAVCLYVVLRNRMIALNGQSPGPQRVPVPRVQGVPAGATPLAALLKLSILTEGAYPRPTAVDGAM
ncbi:hypothetical protein PWT90_00862 [Aphanocladium album]|nr:hypothetical protein PWT90_00862 [Aphanocladium album]